MVYLIRHGLDDENFIGGWSDVSLTPEGIKEVQDAIPILQTLGIKQMIASDIKRARETALLINEVLNVPLKYDERLRELDKGTITGLSKEEADIVFPKKASLTIYDKYPHGEAMIDLFNRIKALLPYLNTLDDTLIVTHRGVINMLYYILKDKPLDMDKGQFNVTHASIHELDVEKKDIRRIY